MTGPSAPGPSAPEPAARLSDDERLAWLRLIRSDNVGPATFRQLLARYGSATAALAALPRIGKRLGRPIHVAGAAAAEAELARLAAFGAALTALPDPDYPAWLRQIDTAPPLLAVAGDPRLLARPAVAIVGARNASVVGRRFAMTLAGALAERGLVVVSGLARGIDAAAHEGALRGGTVAVLAGGIDVVYPPQNEDLAGRIRNGGGALVSEMPFGWQPRARDFPRRNRIVSGLALGVVIVEAAQRSGSLITARLAGEQGRLVFAVPGSPLDPRAAGSNGLLKDGAILVTEADDVAAALDPQLERRPAPPPSPAMSEAVADDAGDGDRRIVLEALGPSPVEIDQVIRFTGLAAAVVQLVLMELDLAGRLERHPGQRVSLIPS